MFVAKAFITIMATDLLSEPNKIRMLIRSAPRRYKVFQIPKRKAGEYRTIAQPAREIKILQRWVLANILDKLPVHPAVTSYRKHTNIRSNALPHRNNPYLLKMDFKDYFPSITDDDFIKYVKDIQLEYDETELHLLMLLLFWAPKGSNKLRLSIGAPTSPALSNSIMYVFDRHIHDFCSENQVVYTRYADDLTFSAKTSSILKVISKYVRDICKVVPYPHITINQDKTIYSSKGNRRCITGLIITNDGNVSIGRKMHRTIRAKMHQAMQGRLDKESMKELKGLLAYARDVDEEFYNRLIKKYGEL